ncbi:MAG TPA: hypothetical protein VG245_03135 [Candidatus Dormibacteraeota bacterium]|jgi:hypothetical protein|nr:hypothetical protein [Candidatus Dormibacteraeota bacterium]
MGFAGLGRRGAAATGCLALLVAGAVPAAGTAANTAKNFTLVGHDPLFNRGMNAAIAVYGHYVYVGSRTDGEPNHGIHTGVLVVDATDPANLKDVGEITLASVDPHMQVGYTSRELRVWPQQKVLMVMYFACSAVLHDCLTSTGDTGLVDDYMRIAFFDLSDPANPRLISSFRPPSTDLVLRATGTTVLSIPTIPHEMFLWVDPKDPSRRALLYWTSPNTTTAMLNVTDISGWRQGQFPALGKLDISGNINAALAAAKDTNSYDVRLHSLSVSPDGKVAYLAHLGGGFLMMDSADFASGAAKPLFRFITPAANRVYWDNQGAHSAVKVPSKPYVVTTEEIYGKDGAVGAAEGSFALSGCPWGWVRIIDIRDPTRPRLASEYRIDENKLSCPAQTDAGYATFAAEDNYSSYASHNPTVLPDVALVTWHSGGLQAIDLSDPVHPTQAGFYLPSPELYDVSQDPVLEVGSDNVIAWSYPIISGGLIYYSDIRNGLYVVRYTGPAAAEVAGVSFLEGNSNVGDAARLEAGVAPTASPSPRLLPNTVSGAGPGGFWPLALLVALMLAGGVAARRRAD